MPQHRIETSRLPFAGIARGNFASFIPTIFIAWWAGLSITTTLLICGTLGFAAMLFEPPLNRWIESRRAKRIVHFVVIPNSYAAFRRTRQNQGGKPADTKPAEPAKPNADATV